MYLTAKPPLIGSLQIAVAKMTRELTLRIILVKPTPGVEYGIQKGNAINYETVQKQKSSSNDLCFEFKVQVKFDEGDNPVFLGPFTQGPPKERFIYIDIGTYAGQKNTGWSRRLKIPLKSISRDIVEKLSRANVLLAKVQGSGGKDGGPTRGTIKPFDGWKVASGKTIK